MSAEACIERARELIRDRSASALLPVSGGSKPGLSGAREGVTSLDVSALSGVVEYDPSELTITARAATPVAELAAVLAEQGQYLPFDPPLASAGATVAGAVAAATSGSSAFRHGGVRDFVIGVTFLDGTGRLVSGGGKVVKNAAGFDLPKLMVGSRGRLGVMTQLSLKVFPRPRATVTERFPTFGVRDAVGVLARVARGPIGLDAADIEPDGTLVLRLGGAPETLAPRAARLAAQVDRAADELRGEDETAYWADVARFAAAGPDAAVVRVPVTATVTEELHRQVTDAGGSVRFTLAANLAWIAWPAAEPLDGLHRLLEALELSGSVLTPSRTGVLGAHRGGAFAERIRAALDPFDRFAEA